MIYGVSIWNNKLFVIDDYELGEEYPVLEISLHSSGTDQLLDQHMFQHVFDNILRETHPNGIDGFIMVIPDTYGFQERWILFKNAELSGVNLLRLIPLSAALALSFPLSNSGGKDAEYVLTFQSDGKNGISAVYDTCDGVYEPLYVHFLRNGHYSKKHLSNLDSLPKHIFKLIAIDNDDIVNRMIQALISHEVARGKAVPSIVQNTHIDVLRGLSKYCRLLSGKSESSILLFPMPTHKLYIESKDILLSLGEELILPTLVEKDFLLEESCFSYNKDTHFLLKEKNFADENRLLAKITIKKEELRPLLDLDSSSNRTKHTYLRFHVKIGFDVRGTMDSFTLEIKNEGNGKTVVIYGFDNLQLFQIRKTSTVSHDQAFNIPLDSMMDILDNLDRAIQATPDAMEAHGLGLTQIKTDILTLLEKNRIHKIDSLGKPFDVKWHHAVGTEKTGQYLSGTVTKVIHTGYYNTETGAIVRYASVIVEE